MSVPKGRRSLSRFEVLYNATLLTDEITSLVLRSFGVYSRNSIMRKRYEHMVSHNNKPYVENLLQQYKDQLIESASNIELYVKSAKSTYPSTIDQFDIRRNFQNNALDECFNIKFILHIIARQFNVDIDMFKNSICLLDKEIHLIKSWRRSDSKRYKYL